MRDNAHTLSDFHVPTLSIECEPCGRRGRYNVAKLMEKHGDMKLPDLLYVLAADCPKDQRCPHLRSLPGQVRSGQPALLISGRAAACPAEAGGDLRRGRLGGSF